ncbi:MAG TPA: DUF2085 domain-containing protein [Pyrinomonadaceae bacterium]|nr:DUF2085 domain-containing protein [Pyrinomonadaceae bacterium]
MSNRLLSQVNLLPPRFSLVRLPPNQYVSQLSSNRRPVVIWTMVAAVSLLLVLAILGAPLARANGDQTLSVAIYGAFGKLCHQIPERSFFIAGHQLAVCARCTGLYFGFATFTFLYPLFRSLRRTDLPERRWLFIAAAPMGIDFALGFFGIWENTHTSRFLTGALLGATAVFYVVPGFLQIDLKEWRQLLRRKGREQRA